MTEAMIEITGTVAERPRPQVLPIGEAGDPLPVLHLVLSDCGPGRKRVTAQQVFPVGGIAACHARAAQLQVGTSVTIQAPVSLVQWHLADVQHIRINKPTKEAAHV